MGMIAIPGNMICAMLNGSDVEQEARQQMIAMFMIATSNALSCIVATHLVLKACIDSEHRIRAESIDADPHALCRAASGFAILAAAGNAGRAWILATSSIRHLLQELRGLTMAAMSISG
jgi:hypothetical protein